MRVLYLAIGCVFVAVGAVGAILPVLPTTPFLLLASFFFTRSSPRLQAALERSRFFGPILLDWRQHRGVRLDVKARAVGMVVLTIGLSIFLTAMSDGQMIATILLGIIGITVIVRLPSVRD